jgi:Zn-dependent protease
VFGAVRPTGRPQLRLFGIPIRVEPIFVVVVVLLGIGPGTDATLLAGWVVIVFASVLLHELGHAAAFVAFGSKPSIVLYGLGGVTSARSPAQRWQSVVVSLAGPVLPLVLIGLPAIVLAESDWTAASDHREVLVRMVVWVNVWWGLINLLPLLPLDGGHVFEQFLGPRMARVLTIVVAIPIAVYAFRQELPFGAVIAAMCGYQAWQQLRAPAPSRAATPNGPGSERWVTGAHLAAVGQPAAAVQTLVEAALAGAPPPPALMVVGDNGLAPELAARLLQLPGERPPVAVAEIASGLLAAGRHEQGFLVAQRLAADTRSAPLQEWAAGILDH